MWQRSLLLLMVRIVAVAVGIGGVILDGLLYRKLFVECLPYKIMGRPPASFYAAIGEHAALVLVLLGCVAAILLVRRAPHLIPLVLTVGTPVLVLVILVIGAVWYGSPVIFGGEFDGSGAISAFVLLGCLPSALIAFCASLVTLLLRQVGRRAAPEPAAR